MDATLSGARKRTLPPRSMRAGLIAIGVLASAYTAIVWGASGSFEHLRGQVAADWFLLVPVMAGFGVQVGLVSELRRRHRMHGGAGVAAAAGTGSSTVGMIACCMHHIADFAPFIAASGAATFLTDYRIAFMVGGLGVNVAGIAFAVRRLRATSAATSVRQEESCAHVH